MVAKNTLNLGKAIDFNHYLIYKKIYFQKNCIKNQYVVINFFKKYAFLYFLDFQ